MIKIGITGTFNSFQTKYIKELSDGDLIREGTPIKCNGKNVTLYKGFRYNEMDGLMFFYKCGDPVGRRHIENIFNAHKTIPSIFIGVSGESTYDEDYILGEEPDHLKYEVPLIELLDKIENKDKYTVKFEDDSISVQKNDELFFYIPDINYFQLDENSCVIDTDSCFFHNINLKGDVIKYEIFDTNIEKVVCKFEKPKLNIEEIFEEILKEQRKIRKGDCVKIKNEHWEIAKKIDRRLKDNSFKVESIEENNVRLCFHFYLLSDADIDESIIFEMDLDILEKN